jgi:hypothetical protein
MAAATLTAGAADAQTIFSGSGCSGNMFTFCASWSGSILAANQFRFNITNTSGLGPANNANSAFTQIAIGGLSLGDPGSMAAVTGWQYDNSVNGFNGFGLNPNDFAAITANGINNALGAGASKTFDFTFSTNVFNGMTGAQAYNSYFTGVQIAIHDQGTPNTGFCAGSSKGVMNGVTGVETSQSVNDCGVIITSTPEPSSYLLMASGLAGVGFIARRRRSATKA